jgi:digeranylgeranylglycerophospholipid reductase
MLKKYDAIIVGAGSAGTLAAKTIAKAGLTTLMIDSKRRDLIGNKICGDAIGEHHLLKLGLKNPNNGVFEHKVKGLKIYSPDKETVFTFTRPDFMGYILNRHLFGQWLLEDALDSGSDLLDSTMFMDPIIEHGAIRGIRAKDRQGNLISIRSKVVVDASGHYGVVRERLPSTMGFEGKLEKENVDVCYREIRQLDQEMDENDFCKIYLNQTNTPGGFTWIFPRKNGQVNTGLGVNLQNNINPRKRFYKTVVPLPLFNNSSIIHKGGGLEPTRRPLDRLVGNGVVLIGDAASLVNPINGGGIGISMESGYFAGEAIIKSLENGEATEERLWTYPCNIMQTYGKELANLEVLRRCLISTSDTNINYGMKHKLLSQEDINRVSEGKNVNSNILKNILRVIKGMRHPQLLNKLRLTSKLMLQVLGHYEKYPTSPAHFKMWQLKTVNLIDQVRTSLQN